MEILIQAGAYVNSQNYKAETALMKAVLSDSVQSMDILIQAGADVNTQNHLGESALLLAAKRSHIDCVEHL